MPGIKLPYIKLHIPFLFSLKTKISMQLSREETTALKKFFYFSQLLFTALPCIYLQEEGQTRESKEEKGPILYIIPLVPPALTVHLIKHAF